VITPRPRLLADSRSTGRLQSSNAHRSMTRLNAGNDKFQNVNENITDKVITLKLIYLSIFIIM